LTDSARDGINFCPKRLGEIVLGKTTDDDQILIRAARILSERRQKRIVEIAQLQSAIDCINNEIDKTTHLAQGAGLNSAQNLRIPRDVFLGMRLSTAVQECLKIRREAMPVGEILQLLKAGGFASDSLGSNADMQLARLAKTLRKNTKTFHRLPNGCFGLVTSYPNILKTPNRLKRNRIESDGLSEHPSNESAM